MRDPDPDPLPEARFEALVRASQDAIVHADARGRIVGFNPAAEAMFGYTGEEILGEPITTLTPERYRERHERKLRSCLSGGETGGTGERVELHVRRKDGSERPVELSLDTWTVEGETYVSAIIRSVSERKARERRLEQRVETWEALGHGISHDLKEPLRTIVSHLQLLDRRLGDLPDQDREMLEDALDASQRLGDLVEGLLSYARAQTRSKEPETVGLDGIADEVLSDLSHLLDEADAEVEVASDLPTVRADPAQVRQVLQNLVQNAVRYAGQRPPGIRIEADRGGSEGFAEVRVHDEGIGIDPDDQGAIFRVSHRAHRSGEGAGIGLAIVRRIVQRHGGQVWVESTPGEGSTFGFTLPAAKDD